MSGTPGLLGRRVYVSHGASCWVVFGLPGHWGGTGLLGAARPPATRRLPRRHGLARCPPTSGRRRWPASPAHGSLRFRLALPVPEVLRPRRALPPACRVGREVWRRPMSPAFMVAFALVLPHGKAAGLQCRRVSWVEVGSFGLSLVFTGNGLDGVPSAGLRTDAGSGRFLRAGPGGWGPARVPAGQTERSRGPCSRPPAPPRFLYSDEVQIGPETVMTTLYTAKKYAVPALEAHCVEFLKKNLRADNAFMLLTQVRGAAPGSGAPVPGMGAACRRARGAGRLSPRCPAHLVAPVLHVPPSGPGSSSAVTGCVFPAGSGAAFQGSGVGRKAVVFVSLRQPVWGPGRSARLRCGLESRGDLGTGGGPSPRAVSGLSRQVGFASSLLRRHLGLGP